MFTLGSCLDCSKRKNLQFQWFSGSLWCGFVVCLGQQHSWDRNLFLFIPLIFVSSVGSREYCWLSHFCCWWWFVSGFKGYSSFYYLCPCVLLVLAFVLFYCLLVFMLLLNWVKGRRGWQGGQRKMRRLVRQWEQNDNKKQKKKSKKTWNTINREEH